MRKSPRLAFLTIAIIAPVCLMLCLVCGGSGVLLPRLDTDAGRAIMALRAQRVAAGFVIGAGLSCAGAVLQALLRNPLAEPYVLGVSSGAGLGAALAILAGLAARSIFALPIAAFAAAAATLTLVYALAASGGRLSIYGLVLSGVIVSSLCSSMLMFLLAVAPADGLHTVMWWMLGNLQVPDPALLAVVSALVLPAVAVVWLLSPELNALTLGQDMAHHLGVRGAVVIPAGLAMATLITGAAVGLAGLIGFVGLVVPHVVRSITGPDHRRLLPACFLCGGLFLALADAAARTVLAPREIPVGIVTSLIGGPFFLAILQSRRKRGWVD